MRTGTDIKQFFPVQSIALYFLVWTLFSLHTGQFIAHAQVNELGAPQIWTTTYNKIEMQYFCAQQDKRGVMYFGSADGLLEFDGVSWRNLGSLNDSPAYSMAMDSSGRLYFGTVGELGYLRSDSIGRSELTSLKKQIPKNAQSFDVVLDIVVLDSIVYFVTPHILFLWDGSSMEMIEQTNTTFRDAFVADGVLYVLAMSDIYRLHGKRLIQAARLSELARSFENLFVIHGSTMLLGFEGTTASMIADGKVMLLGPAVQNILRTSTVTHVVQLPDSLIAIGTSRHGVLVINCSGDLVMILDKNSGLPAFWVLSQYVDPQNGFWIMTSKGISHVDWPAPISVHREEFGLVGACNSIIRHKGILYVATTDGLYRLVQQAPLGFHRSESKPLRRWELVPGSESQCFSLLSTGADLFIGSSRGLLFLDEGVVRSVGRFKVLIREVLRSRKDPNRIYAGGDDLISFSFRNGAWKFETQIQSVPHRIWSMAESPDGDLWLGSTTEGVVRLDYSGGFTSKPHVTRFDTTHGLQSMFVFTTSTSRGLIFPTQEGLFLFNPALNRFEQDTLLLERQPELQGIPFFPLADDLHGNIWSYHWKNDEPAPGRWIRTSTGAYQWNVGALRIVDPAAVYCIYPEDSKVVWFGRPSSVIRYDYSKEGRSNRAFNTLIRSVTIGRDSALYFGNRIQQLQPIEIPFGRNTVRFDFAAMSYSHVEGNEYQILLDGYDDQWSSWFSETRKEYANLPAGTYVFRVRSRDIYGTLGNEDAFELRILPPLYLTSWAFLFYAAALVAMVIGIVRMRTRQLERHKQELEEKVRIRTAQISRQSEEISLQKRELERINETLERFNEELKLKNEQIISTQQQLITQEKLASLGSLTAGIAHEIQNPLNFVNNFAGLTKEMLEELADELKDSSNREQVERLIESLIQNARMMMDHGERASSIIRSMLQHSRVRKGEAREIDLNRLLDDSVALAYHGIRGSHANFSVALEKNYDPNIPKMYVIPEDISRVFLNIVNNACYAAHQKWDQSNHDVQPIVRITTAFKDNTAVVRIRDNGTGIPKELREQIFQPFFTTKPTGIGTGLGLSISYDIIVQLHGGSLTFESEPGEFTEFILKLPRKAVQKND